MAPCRTRLQRAGTGRDVLALYLFVLGFVTLEALADGWVLRSPGIALLAAFDVLQTAFAPGISDIAVDVARALYLYVIAVGFAGLYRTARRRFDTTEE